MPIRKLLLSKELKHSVNFRPSTQIPTTLNTLSWVHNTIRCMFYGLKLPNIRYPLTASACKWSRHLGHVFNASWPLQLSCKFTSCIWLVIRKMSSNHRRWLLLSNDLYDGYDGTETLKIWAGHTVWQYELSCWQRWVELPNCRGQLRIICLLIKW